MFILYKDFVDNAGIIAEFTFKKHNRRTTSSKIILGHEGSCGFRFFSKRQNFDGRDLINIKIIATNINELKQLEILNEINNRKVKRIRKIRKLIKEMIST